MSGVRKSFGATRALNGVSFAVAPGEVHALIGENGAGKSTLMKVLSGAYQPDTGSLELDGQPFVPENPLHARRCGIAMIYQELNLAPDLSVEENILLGSEPARFGWIQPGRRRELAHRALAELRHDSIPLEAPVQSLTIAEKQVVEIARALVGNPKVLIMDEPTSSLTKVDTENLFAVIGKLRQRGVSVVYISHFLEECQRICDRYTVLRDGESVGTGRMEEVDLSEIIRLMVGREVKDIYPRTPHALGRPVLELKEAAGITKPQSVSLTLRAGEILGIAGLIGTGRTETLRACFGLDRLARGTVHIAPAKGRDTVTRGAGARTATSASEAGGGERALVTGGRSAAHSLAHGVGLLSENRKEEGLMLNRDLADNLTITRFGPLSRFGFISRKRQWEGTAEWMRRLDVRGRSPGQAVGELSGGNQQKVAIGRLLHHDASILLLDEPTRGIDVGSKAQIYKLMGELAATGKALIFVSSYLPELLGVCDTLGVMCRGVLSEVRPVHEWTEHAVIAAAVGANDE